MKSAKKLLGLTPLFIIYESCHVRTHFTVFMTNLNSEFLIVFQNSGILLQKHKIPPTTRKCMIFHPHQLQFLTLIACTSNRCSDYRLMSPCCPLTSRLIVQIKFDVRGDDDTYLSSSPTAGYLDFSQGRHTPIPAPNPASNFVRSIEE